mmetsp:Transcript_42/g.200  ORF Transcript_42/g.200 Transcript_42/m.200 type:complete len:90 (-) Transcript_42:311-580(-)
MPRQRYASPKRVPRTTSAAHGSFPPQLDFQKLISNALWRVVFIRYGGRVARALAIGVGIGLGLRIGAWSLGYRTLSGSRLEIEVIEDSK